MQSWLSFEVDGREVRAERISTRMTLADYLAEGAQKSVAGLVPGNEPWQGGELIGMLDADAEGRPVYRTVDASLFLVVQAADRRFVTPAGLCAAGASHPVVEALGRHPLLDCDGDGLANVLMCLFEGYHRGAEAFVDPRCLGEQVDACLGRTTDYPRLRQAALEVFRGDQRSPGEAEKWTQALAAAPLARPDLQYLDPSKRRFYRPQTVVEALKLKRQYGNAVWVSGGTDLGEKAWRRGAEWEVMISLDGIAEMHAIFETANGEFEVGAAAPLSVIGERLGDEFPLLRKMLRRFGSRAVRNRATLGGHLASASPSGDLWPVLMAMDARVRLVSEKDERDVPVASFADGPGRTTLRPGEVIRSVVVPRASAAALKKRGIEWRLSEAYKSAQRRHLSRAMVAGAFCIDLDKEGIIRIAILAYAGLADRPFRARETEKKLIGKKWQERTVFGALEALDREIDVTLDDGLASSAYRRQLVITLFQKFFYQYPTADSSGRELGVIGEMLAPKKTTSKRRPGAEESEESSAATAILVAVTTDEAKPEVEVKPTPVSEGADATEVEAKSK